MTSRASISKDAVSGLPVSQENSADMTWQPRNVYGRTVPPRSGMPDWKVYFSPAGSARAWVCR